MNENRVFKQKFRVESGMGHRSDVRLDFLTADDIGYDQHCDVFVVCD